MAGFSGSTTRGRNGVHNELVVDRERRDRTRELCRAACRGLSPSAPGYALAPPEPRLFRLHGDNVVECERTLDLILAALASLNPKLVGPVGSPVCPTYGVMIPGHPEIHLTFLPGYGGGRWKSDILEAVRRRGGVLREAADAIVCEVVNGVEDMLFAIEYCGALPAGNQAWQRNGRALSFAAAGVPYLYIAELGGFELDDSRARKAERLPNPAVPFSYLVTCRSFQSMAVPVYIPSPGASAATAAKYAAAYGEKHVLGLVRAYMLGDSPAIHVQALQEHAVAAVQILAGARRGKDSLSPSEWDAAWKAVNAGSALPGFLCTLPGLKWKKTAYIAGLTASAQALMAAAAEVGIGFTSTNLPICLIPAQKRATFSAAIQAIHPHLSAAFLTWVSGATVPLTVCWVMGFKPGGEDARPDRGLPPLARMLAGADAEILSIVYGPAPASHWTMMSSQKDKLASQNGLWQAVLHASDALLADSATLPGQKAHAEILAISAKAAVAVRGHTPVDPVPARFGEQDVDTVIHTLLAKLGSATVFEGMCNPPGGDWSGISRLVRGSTTEHRWLVLPRVTAGNEKRPDHVFQILTAQGVDLAVAIESKDASTDIEPAIGPRLARYLGGLFASTPSIVRDRRGAPWRHFAGTAPTSPLEVATAAAFVSRGEEDLRGVAARAQVDLVIAARFGARDGACVLRLHAPTALGKSLAAAISAIGGGQLDIVTQIV